MTNVIQNRVSLDEAVEDLKQKAQKHFIEVHNAQEAKHIAVDKLDNALKAIVKYEKEL